MPGRSTHNLGVSMVKDRDFQGRSTDRECFPVALSTRPRHIFKMPRKGEGANTIPLPLRLTKNEWGRKPFHVQSQRKLYCPFSEKGKRVHILQFGQGRLPRTLIDTAFEEMRRDYGWPGLIAMTQCRPAWCPKYPGA